VTFLKGLGDVADHPDHLACIVETNRGLLIAALLDVDLPVYPVNPTTVDRRRKPSGAKTDAIDAYLSNALKYSQKDQPVTVGLVVRQGCNERFARVAWERRRPLRHMVAGEGVGASRQHGRDRLPVGRQRSQ